MTAEETEAVRLEGFTAGLAAGRKAREEALARADESFAAELDSLRAEIRDLEEIMDAKHAELSAMNAK